MNPPGGIVVTPVSYDQIDVSWDAVAGVLGYRLNRQRWDGAWVADVVVDDITTTSYSDMGLEQDTLYRYRVASIGDDT